MLARRVVAFIIDVIIIAVPLIVGWMFIFVFGLITFGLGWALFWLMSPGSVIWALVYYGVTLGSPASATIGMRAMEIEMRTWYGAPAYFVLGAVHAIVFWIRSACSPPLSLWSASSTTGGDCCTTFWWAPSSSITRRERLRCGARGPRWPRNRPLTPDRAGAMLTAGRIRLPAAKPCCNSS